MTMWALAQGANAVADSTSNDVFFLWGCGLFAVAVVLFIVEFFIPSGGLVGILCGVALVASVVAFFRYDPSWGAGVGIAYLIVVPLAIVFAFRLWLNSPIGRAMILGDSSDGGADAPEDAAISAQRARQARNAELRTLIGTEGTSETALRPVGTVRIQGERIEALAESGVIAAGETVVVTEVYDNQIKVRVKTT